MNGTEEIRDRIELVDIAFKLCAMVSTFLTFTALWVGVLHLGVQFSVVYALTVALAISLAILDTNLYYGSRR